jgi:hypothetical protein
MKPTRVLLLGLFASAVVLLSSASAWAASSNVGFGFNARDISGISGAVTLTGGGAYNTALAPRSSSSTRAVGFAALQTWGGRVPCVGAWQRRASAGIPPSS